VGNQRAELVAKVRVMVLTGMRIGVRVHVCGQDILENGLQKWGPFYRLQQLDNNRDPTEFLAFSLPTGESHFHAADVTKSQL